MNKREFLMLAKEDDPKHDISGWWVSEKLDGMRGMWDGGVSRGLLATDVPYANTAKDGRFVTPPIATGLWSRYGKVIHAPDWWLNDLPTGINLDMELWMGRGTFQQMRSIVGSMDKGEGWRGVKGYVIDSPGWHAVLADGEMTGTNWKGYLDRSMLAWVESRGGVAWAERGSNLPYGIACPWPGAGQPDECFAFLKKLRQDVLSKGSSWEPMVQTKLPTNLHDARSAVDDMLLLVTQGGGEGLILRSPTAAWVPKRVPWVLKVKKLNDAEGTVIGMTWGRRTDLGSRHLGRMGALILRLKNGKRMELSGFTDEERAIRQRREDPDDHRLDWTYVVGEPEFETLDDQEVEVKRKLVPAESLALEGKDATDAWEPFHFRIGSQVTFTYRDLTNDGIPKEARYLRKREVE